MSTIVLPQFDSNPAKRKQDIAREAAPYRYNNEIGIPLIEAEGPRDKDSADWNRKVVQVLMNARSNVQKIYDQSGLKFYKPRPVRDLAKFTEYVRSGGNLVDYFTPDLGFIKGDADAGRPKSIDDYVDKIFIDRDGNNRGNAPLPDIARVWDSDITFAYTFLAGPNPNQLQRYPLTNRPRDFDLTGFDLTTLDGFSGDSIERAIGDGRVYYVDHSDLTALFANIPGAPAKNAAPRVFEGVRAPDWKYIYAPYAAFALPPNGSHLMPIAIQCGPKSDGHLLITPNDGNTWKMARVCVLAAHNNHHEVVAHLGHTHLLIDPVVMATRTKLHPSHPVYALLDVHIVGTVPINASARTSLLLPERSVDRLIGSKIEMNYPYLKQQRLGFSFRDNFIRTRMASRGVEHSGRLPNYPYRDDAFLLWDAIHSWCADFVGAWYGSDADIRADYELQDWADEIHNVGKVRDFCLKGGGVLGRDDLCDMLTMIIFTAGPQHAAVNFPQGTDMSHVPSNPLAGYAQAPMTKGGHTERDLLAMFPPMDVAVQTWQILKLLAGVWTTRLGDYGLTFANHPKSLVALAKFTARLKMVESTIDSANGVRRKIYALDYVHLKPSRIPASINI